MALNYDSLTATTRKYYIRALADNVFNDMPTLRYFTRRARSVPGGEKIVQPLIYAKNTARGSFRKYDVLDVSPTDEFTAAEFEWKQLYVTVTISDLEEAQNRGDLAVLNLLESKMEVARLSLRDMFSEQLWGDGTGNNGKDITGILAAVDDGTHVDLYGGIVRSEQPWWKAQYHDAGGQPLTLSMVNHMITRCTDGSERPDLIVTTPELWDRLWELFQAQQRYEAVQVADTGFDKIRFRGIDVIFDRYCPEGTVWFFNTKHIQLRPHVDYRNFKDSGWKKPINQAAAVMQIFWLGNLTSSNCRRQGVIWNVSAEG